MTYLGYFFSDRDLRLTFEDAKEAGRLASEISVGYHARELFSLISWSVNYSLSSPGLDPILPLLHELGCQEN